MIEYLDFFKVHVRNFQFNQYYRNISPSAVLRRMQEWHLNMFDGDVSDYDRYNWEGSGLNDFTVHHENCIYIFQEIKTGLDLVNESIEMHHCVASYVESCLSGEIHIWSVKKRLNNSDKSFITMEITQSKVTQSRKKHNAELCEKEFFFIETLESYYKSETGREFIAPDAVTPARMPRVDARVRRCSPVAFMTHETTSDGPGFRPSARRIPGDAPTKSRTSGPVLS